MTNGAIWADESEAALEKGICTRKPAMCKKADAVRSGQEFGLRTALAAIGGHGFMTLLANGDTGYGKPWGRRDQGLYLLMDKNGRVIKVGETNDFKRRQGDYNSPQKYPGLQELQPKIMVLFLSNSGDIRKGVEDVVYDALKRSGATRSNRWNKGRMANPQGNSESDQAARDRRLDARKIGFRFFLRIGIGLVVNGRGNAAIHAEPWIKTGGLSRGPGMGRIGMR
ncbi:hypothetical protein [Nonomuraea sp. bgisy101]|uniref:hypothetical protein n=1 Tax=Nonomuraea sp. bgisy101 TaxID=3413784 RepID=UPI003D71DA60